jgi:hypothetical protein
MKDWSLELNTDHYLIPIETRYVCDNALVNSSHVVGYNPFSSYVCFPKGLEYYFEKGVIGVSP